MLFFKSCFGLFVPFYGLCFLSMIGVHFLLVIVLNDCSLGYIVMIYFS